MGAPVLDEAKDPNGAALRYCAKGQIYFGAKEILLALVIQAPSSCLQLPKRSSHLNGKPSADYPQLAARQRKE